MKWHYPDGATPLDPDEADGLIPNHITLQSELNTWEATNILQAERWLIRQKNRNLFDELFVRELHRRMFGKTWHWAGTFRKSNKNIGVDWPQIAVRLRDLLINSAYQLENKVFEIDELAVRLHHQMVFIHPFPNGNGRHARLIADAFLLRMGQPRFSWGRHSLNTNGTARLDYLNALRHADQGDIRALLSFCRR